jgi:predicted DNA-binding mobile mystery protein A
MKPQYRNLRLRQVSRSLAPFTEARSNVRPTRGWLRAVRKALGLSLKDVAKSIGVRPSHLISFEKAEARDRITLDSLKKYANAMGCELVYGLVPKSGTFPELAERRARKEAMKRVLPVQHSMALENQAAGGVEDRINEETRRILKGSKD